MLKSCILNHGCAFCKTFSAFHQSQSFFARYFTTQDASTALRPFYFIVHPDMFGQHPEERAVNEHSLKQLSEYIASLQSQHPKKSTDIVFYIRQKEGKRTSLKPVTIALASNLRDTVLSILTSCGLSSSHVPEAKAPYTGTNRPIVWHHSYYTATGQSNPNQKPNEAYKKPAALTLRSWLKLNIKKSQEGEDAVKHIRNDIDQLSISLKKELGLREIRFDSVWGYHHFRGCLKAFTRFYNTHPKFLKFVFKDQLLVFGNTTGVNRSGEIVLSGEDVPETWLTLLKSVGAYVAVVQRLPLMEDQLSDLLKGIQVVREERSHSPVRAEVYELQLNRVLNSMRRCQGLVDRAFGRADLSHLRLAVEAEQSPLTLSSHGHFLIPASIPGSLVVDYISKNRTRAAEILLESAKEQFTEEVCREEAAIILGVARLSKDESVTPEQMAQCCRRLAEQHVGFANRMLGRHLRVSHYYSVMQDGEICFPWDWVGDDD